MKLAVIFGGTSTEHDVSVVSGTSVIKNLDKDKYDIIPIYIDTDGTWYKYTKNTNDIDILSIGDKPAELEKIDNVLEILKKQEVIFPVLHGLYGEDGTTQGLFEIANVPYVGCKVLASSIAMDKVYTKVVIDKAGIKQAKLLGNTFRSQLYFSNKLSGEDLLRLHSTYQHDLKCYSSEEGRNLKTAAAFLQGLLQLDGSLIPIVTSMVRNDEKVSELLDANNSDIEFIISLPKIHSENNETKFV